MSLVSLLSLVSFGIQGPYFLVAEIPSTYVFPE